MSRAQRVAVTIPCHATVQGSVHSERMSEELVKHVSPYLGYPDGQAATAWLREVLGFGETRSTRDEDGNWYEGEIRAGSSTIYIGGGSPMEPGSGTGAALVVQVTDVDAVHERAVAAGAQADPPQDRPYGPRVCEVADPWGYRWFLWQGNARYP